MRKTSVLLLAVAAFVAQAQETSRPAKAGDVAVYAVDAKTERLQYEETVTVTAVEGGQLKTRHVRSDRPAPLEGLYGTDWSTLRSGASGTVFEPAIVTMQHPLAPGKTWEGSHETTGTNRAKSRLKMEYAVVGREKVRVPAGEFDAWRIETKGYISGLSWQGGWGIQQKIWYAPAIDRIVRTEWREQRTMGADTVTELKEFRPAN